MSRLDRHVAAVQNKLAFSRFVHSFALAGTIFAAAVFIAVLVYKFFQFAPPKPMIWFFGALGVAVLAAIIVAMWRRPTSHEAAIAIDQRLGLNEKFSTALMFRPSSDPFAKAAVRDAEV